LQQLHRGCREKRLDRVTNVCYFFKPIDCTPLGLMTRTERAAKKYACGKGRNRGSQSDQAAERSFAYHTIILQMIM
jgi:hypothetical protein